MYVSIWATLVQAKTLEIENDNIDFDGITFGHQLKNIGTGPWMCFPKNIGKGTISMRYIGKFSVLSIVLQFN
jgi:hypothetical protein